MIKKSVDLLNTLDRELIVEQTLRSNLLGESSIFNYNGYKFYYDIKDDLVVLKGVSKKVVTKEMILPPIFEAIGTGALHSIKNIVSLDAKYIKKIYSNGIKCCTNLKWLDLSSCKYFDKEAISGSEKLCKILFNESIDYLGKSFIDGQNCTYYFGNVKNLDDYCFEKVRYLRLVGNSFNNLFYTNECNIKINYFDKIKINFIYYPKVDERIIYYGGTLIELEQKLKLNNRSFNLRSLKYTKIIASDGVFSIK